jgi:hypothetical protein
MCHNAGLAFPKTLTPSLTLGCLPSPVTHVGEGRPRPPSRVPLSLLRLSFPLLFAGGRGRGINRLQLQKLLYFMKFMDKLVLHES